MKPPKEIYAASASNGDLLGRFFDIEKIPDTPCTKYIREDVTKLTWHDISYIFGLIETLMCEQGKPALPGDEEFCKEVLKRYYEK